MSTRVLQELIVAAEMTGTELSKAALRGMEIELDAYPEDAVLKALARVRRELKHRLTLADILERLAGSDGRPSGDEAWARALQSFDENNTVVINGEIAQAMEVARPIYEERDKVGARMAFLKAYERAVQDAKDRGEAPHWWASIGMDPTRREGPVREAVRTGLLSREQAVALLPGPAQTAEGQRLLGTMAALLAAPESAPAPQPADIRQKLIALRDELAGKKTT